MKIMFSPLIEPLVLSDEYVTSVVIENRKRFYQIVCDLYNQVNKCDGEIVFSQSDKVIDVAKNIELITQFVPFDCNRKTLVTKLQQKIKETASNEYYADTAQVLSLVQKYLFEITDMGNYVLTMDDVDVAGLLKIANVRFSDDFDSLSANIFNYCTNVIGLEGDKLFVIVGLRNYVEDEEYELLVRTLVDHKLRVMFLENHCYPICKLEKRTIIDMDLCVI